MSYDVIKALHLISVMSWMAGLLYLPRLFVYHAETTVGSVRAETFKVMERRLLKAIMNPAMIASFVFGIWMIVLAPGLLYEPWMYVKILCVLLMAACHGVFSKMRRGLENDEPPRPPRTYRIWNEVPTILMVIIVFMALVKPSFS